MTAAFRDRYVRSRRAAIRSGRAAPARFNIASTPQPAPAQADRPRTARRPGIAPGLPKLRAAKERPAEPGSRSSLHHSAHVRHATAAAAVLLRHLGDDRLGREDVLGDGGGVEAVALLGLAHLVDDDRALEPGVLGDLTQRLLERAQHDLRAGLLVLVLDQVELDGGTCLEQRDTAARHDALLERGAGGLQRVLDAVLLLLHLGLGGRADLDDGDTARQLRETLLELLAIEVRVGVLDLGLDLVDPALDRGRITGAVDDRRVVLRHDDAAGAPELGDLGVLELQAHLLGDHLGIGQDRDVLEHPLAAIAETGSLERDAGEGAAELVDDERRKGLTLDVLGDDQQRLARLDDSLEHRQNVANGADLLVGDEDVGILQHGLHAVLVGDHVGRDVALVELHALGELEVHTERLALLDVDHAVLADPLDGVGDDVADLLVAG